MSCSRLTAASNTGRSGRGSLERAPENERTAPSRERLLSAREGSQQIDDEILEVLLRDRPLPVLRLAAAFDDREIRHVSLSVFASGPAAFALCA